MQSLLEVVLEYVDVSSADNGICWRSALHFIVNILWLKPRNKSRGKSSMVTKENASLCMIYH
ncbi:CLL_collapsed_G0029380.mRNA.1.CDS.1 [Saccharomyces cerevisiae]|nr:CLL_collapsed_G0029380.mRNA.1.CDS.1 [Saccharomyces cerevisiae]